MMRIVKLEDEIIRDMHDGSEGKDPLVWKADAFLLPLSQDQCLRLPTVSADSTGVMEDHGRPGDRNYCVHTS